MCWQGDWDSISYLKKQKTKKLLGKQGVWFEALCKDSASGWTSELNSFEYIAQMFIFAQKVPQNSGAGIFWAFP